MTPKGIQRKQANGAVTILKVERLETLGPHMEQSEPKQFKSSESAQKCCFLGFWGLKMYAKEATTVFSIWDSIDGLSLDLRLKDVFCRNFLMCNGIISAYCSL